MTAESPTPVRAKQRYVILDAVRGFALIGIGLANYPEFSLYTFKSAEEAVAMSSATADQITHFLQLLFIDGKFYTIFSLLFGIGFSIIISNTARKGADGFRIFYRRMFVLMLIGFLHLMFIWSGDILMLYALMGMLLPLFRNVSDWKLLASAAFFLFLPIIVDTVTERIGVSLSAPVVEAQWRQCSKYGITHENFGVWLRDAESYREVFQFLVQGSLERMQEFIDGNRYFKVFGLFLTGFYIGRKRIYANLQAYQDILRKIVYAGLFLGLPMSLIYAMHATDGYPLGKGIHAVYYFVSVYPTGLMYIALMCLFYLQWKHLKIWNLLAAMGRMALTNYIFQSVIGMFLFYGIGFGLGAGMGLLQTELTALGVFIFQTVFSHIWLKYFQFGPLEWIWRMLTYGKYMKMRSND